MHHFPELRCCVSLVRAPQHRESECSVWSSCIWQGWGLLPRRSVSVHVLDGEGFSQQAAMMALGRDH